MIVMNIFYASVEGIRISNTDPDHMRVIVAEPLPFVWSVPAPGVWKLLRLRLSAENVFVSGLQQFYCNMSAPSPVPGGKTVM